MKRDLQAIGQEEYDLVVIGGGIVGACTARDAARRGLSVALVEKHDFAHATSAASSKLIHGGLRYLANLEISMVRESLRERRAWEVIAPHLVYPIPMIIPIYEHDSHGRLTIRAGLTLYDLLSFDRNWLDDDDQKIPGHRSISADEAVALEPTLERNRLSGAMLYHDCQMFSPERLAFECLLDAVDHGARIANYAEVTGFLLEDQWVRGIEVRDGLLGGTAEIRGSVTVNASGPWADRLLGRLGGFKASANLVRSKGIHVITRSLTRSHAITAQADSGHVFILPWRDHSLIGTTDTVYEGEPDEFHVTQGDVDEFLVTINKAFPQAGLARDDVLGFYGGMRPLVVESGCGSGGSYSASRRAEITDHAQGDQLEGLVSALGGKWTTARHVGEQVVDVVATKLGRKLHKCDTDDSVLPGGGVGRFVDFAKQARERHRDLSPTLIDSLARNYGTRLDGVVELAKREPALGRRLSERLPEIGAQIVHAVREEMAVTLEDLMFRRTGLGTLGDPGAAALEAAADLAARELGWDEPEKRRQVESVRGRYTLAPT